MKEKVKTPELIFVGGITGSGKTSITQEIGKKSKDVKIVHGSHALMDFFGNKSYGDLNEISEEKQRQGRIELFSELRHKKGKIILLDGHYVIFSAKGKTIPTVEEDWVKYFDRLIHLNVEPHVILDRLLADPANFRRRLLNLTGLNRSIIEKIKMTQEISIETASKISTSLGIPLYFVDNSSQLEETIKGVEKIIYSK